MRIVSLNSDCKPTNFGMQKKAQPSFGMLAQRLRFEPSKPEVEPCMVVLKQIKRAMAGAIVAGAGLIGTAGALLAHFL